MLKEFLKKPISRRQALKGAVYGGALVGTVSLLSGCTHKANTDEKNPTVLDDSAGIDILENFKEVELFIKQTAKQKLELGSVLHESQGSWIAFCAPGTTPAHMTKAAALHILNGKKINVVTSCIQKENNWVIYDVACSDFVYAWLELNTLTYEWVLYAAPFNDGSLGGASILWQANQDYDPPSFVCVGKKVIWQVMPRAKGKKSTESSYCYLWNLGDKDATAAVESKGRFATPVFASGNWAVLTPRIDTQKGSQQWGICAYTLKDNLATVADQLPLPTGVKPLYASYTGQDFIFSIEATYDKKGLLGKMGTYIGKDKGPYLVLNREPFAPVCTNGQNIYIVKNRSSYLVIDASKKVYAVLPSEDRCVDYGEYPATTGIISTFITYATVKSEDSGYPSDVIVRSFAI